MICQMERTQKTRLIRDLALHGGWATVKALKARGWRADIASLVEGDPDFVLGKVRADGDSGGRPGRVIGIRAVHAEEALAEVPPYVEWENGVAEWGDGLTVDSDMAAILIRHGFVDALRPQEYGLALAMAPEKVPDWATPPQEPTEPADGPYASDPAVLP